MLAADLVVRAGPRAYDATFEMLRAQLTDTIENITARAKAL
jgi:RNase P protein component